MANHVETYQAQATKNYLVQWILKAKSGRWSTETRYLLFEYLDFASENHQVVWFDWNYDYRNVAHYIPYCQI